MSKIIQGNNPQTIVEKDETNFFTLWKKEEQNPFLGFFLSIEEDKIIAYLLYTEIYDRIEIEQFMVLDSFRNHGIGTQLLQKLIEYATDKQLQNITLEVREDNKSALHLYRKMGFQEVSKRKGYYQEIDGILMIKKL